MQSPVPKQMIVRENDMTREDAVSDNVIILPNTNPCFIRSAKCLSQKFLLFRGITISSGAYMKKLLTSYSLPTDGNNAQLLQRLKEFARNYPDHTETKDTSYANIPHSNRN